MSKFIREGITTGTCAAAASKAAICVWIGKQIEIVRVTNPQQQEFDVPIKTAYKTPSGGRACVIKDAGDDPDITNGTEIWAEVNVYHQMEGKDRVNLFGGEGVGKVTKPGLKVPVGQPAINPVPRQMIIKAVEEVLPQGYCADVTISVPKGAELAAKTLNPYLGIQGGISIIGTTGIVRPMSEEAFKDSLKPQISVVKASGFDDIVFVPGKIGQDIASSILKLPEETIVQTSNFIGYMLESAADYEIKRVLFVGHLGKIIKVAGGIFHTHSKMADARMEILAANLAALGAARHIVCEILECTTTEAAMPIIESNNLCAVYNILAEKASQRSERHVFKRLQVGTVIVTMKGEILGMDEKAREIGGSLGWKIK